MTETLTRPPQEYTLAAVQRDVTSLLNAVKSGAEPLDIEDQGLVFDVSDHLCTALLHTPALADKIADLLETFAQSQSTLGVYARVFVSRHACTLPDFDPSRVHIFDGISKQGDDFSAVVWHRTIMGDRTSRVNQTDLTTYLAQANRYQLLLYVGTNKDMSLRATELAYNMAYDSPIPDTTTDHVPVIKPAEFEAVKALHTLQKMPIARDDIHAKIIQTLQRSPLFARPRTQKTQAPEMLPKLRLHMAAAVTRTPTRPATKINVPALARLKASVITHPAKQQPTARAAFKQAAKPNPAQVIQKLNAPALARLKTPVITHPAKQQPTARAAFKQVAKPNPARIIQRLNAPALARLKTPVITHPAKQQPTARTAFKQAAKPNPVRVIQRLNAPALAHLRPKPSLRQIMQRAAAPVPARSLPRAGIHARMVRTVQPRIIQRAASARAVFQRASVVRNVRIIPKVFAPTLAYLRGAARAERRTVGSSTLTTVMHRVAINTAIGRRPEPLNAPAFKRVPQPRMHMPRSRLPQKEAIAPSPMQQVRTISEPEQKVSKQLKPETAPPEPIPAKVKEVKQTEPLQFVHKPQPSQTPPPQTIANAKQPPQRAQCLAEPEKPTQHDRPTAPPKYTPILEPIRNPIEYPIPILNRILKFLPLPDKGNIHDTPPIDKPIDIGKTTPLTPASKKESQTLDTLQRERVKRLVEPKIDTPQPLPTSNEPKFAPKPTIQLDEKGKVRECCTPEFQKAVLAAAALAAQQTLKVAEPTAQGTTVFTQDVNVTFTPEGIVLRDTKTGESRTIPHAELKRNEDDHARFTEELKKQKPNRTNPIRPPR